MQMGKTIVTDSYLCDLSADDEAGQRPTGERCLEEVMDLEALYDRCMGNVDLMERVLNKFETRLPEELAELERLLRWETPR